MNIFNMEDDKIRILEIFSLVSKIIPYYGWNHRMFLILSQLNKASRNKLDQFYEEFVNISEKFRLEVIVDEHSQHKLKLPADFFRFHLIDKWEENLEIFINFTCMIEKKEGWYFEGHYLHEHLCFNDIWVSIEFTVF